MKLTKKQEKDIWQVYDTWLGSYLNGDVETYNSYLDDDFHFIGSATKEEFLNRKDTTQFFTDTGDQFAGKTEIRNESKIIEQFSDLIFITHVFDGWFIHEKEWNFYSRFRFSSTLRKNKDGWRFIYQHFSIPDAKTAEGETIGYDKTNEENQELREAIQRRTIELEQKNRELEIESSLERVRAIAMGMQKSEDLMSICKIVFDELQALGFTELRNTLIHVFVDEESYFTNYDYSFATGENINKIPFRGNPTIEKFIKVIRKSDVAFSQLTIKGKELKDWKAFRKTNKEYEDKRLDDAKSLHYYNYSVGSSGIGISTYSQISKEKQDLLQRFRNVFQLSYKRYIDISNAEAQAKETRIDLALERVRSQALAMKQSSDLLDIVVTMRNEFTKLGYEAHYFWHMMWLPEIYEKAMTSADGSKIGFVMKLPRHIHGDIPLLAKWEKSKNPTVVYAMNVDEALDYVHKMVTLGDFQNIDPQAPSDDDIRHIGGLTFIMARTTHGEIGYSLPGIVENPPKEDLDILVRFAGAFDLAHRRFLDLQKAEAQARDTEIELALERVRARTMAMHHGGELTDIALLLFQQISMLGIKPRCSGFLIVDEASETMEDWSANLDEKGKASIVTGKLSFNQHPILESVAATWRKKEPYFIGEIHDKELQEYFKAVTYLEATSKAIRDKVLSKTKSEFTNSFYFEYGMMYVLTPKAISMAEINIMLRFAKVFKQTYTRFLDLQKAEAQAREAQIETALEKVRSRTMAMQQSTELPEAANNLFLQVQALGIPAWSAGYCIWEDDKKKSTWCNMSSEGEIQKGFSLPTIGEGYNFFDPIKNGETFHVAELGDKKLVKHYDFMKTLPGIGDVLKEFDKKGIKLPTFQIFHIVYFTHGFLMFITYEPVPNDWEIFNRFGKVFQQTYTRFLDLQKAEAQARESEIELALERVRARTMAMKKSDELAETSFLLFEQFKNLGATSNQFSIGVFNEVENSMELYSTLYGAKWKEVVKVDLNEPVVMRKIHTAWKSKRKSLIIDLSGKDLQKYNAFRKKLSLVNFNEKRWVIHTTFFSKGVLNISTTKPCSTDTVQLLERFAAVFDGTYTRFLDLQKAESQTRTAQINLAVERVRAKALAMHKSEEIMEVVAKLKNEVMSLDIPDVIAATIFLNEGENKVRMWDLSSLEKNNDGYEIPFDIIFKLKNKDPHLYVKRVWENPDNYFLEKQEAKDFKRIIAWLRENDKTQVADEVEAFINKTKLQCLHHAVKKLNNGKLVIDSLNEPTNEMETILTKMGAAFDLAYKRFEDLQKAEAQAKEAQIEAALERVRSRSMAMHKSEELLDVISVVSEQLQQLGMKFSNASFGIFTGSFDFDFWVAAPGINHPFRIHLPYLDSPIFNRLKEALINEQSFFADSFNAIETKQWMEHLFANNNIVEFTPQTKEYLLSKTGFVRSSVLLRNIILSVINYEGIQYSNKENDIYIRFANAFEQAYTRFLDLQKAEAQTRESEIQLAIERVRARTMAMQKSEELADTSVVVFKQLLELGIAPNRLFIGIVKDNGTSIEAWATSEDGSKLANQFTLQASKNKSIKKMLTGWKQQKKSLVIDLKGKELQDYFQYLNEEKNIPFIHGLEQKRRVQTIAYFSGGLIGLAAPKEQPEETTQLLERFADVFNLTYTRFNDLKVAEAQAKEAKIEISLEKVRTVALSLKKSDDILDIAQVLYEQLLVLGFTDIRNAIIDIHNDDDETFLDYDYSHDMSSAVTLFSFYGDPVIEQQIKKIQSSNDAFFEIELKGKELDQLIETRLRNGEKDDPRLHKIDHLTYNLYSFGNGAIGISNFGTLDDDQKKILKRFRNVFTFAYKRYTDLAKAEAQAMEAKIEAALEKVRSVSLSLNKSEDMLEVAQALYEQLLSLGFTNIRNSIIDIDNDDGATFLDYDYSHEMGGTVTLMSYKDDPTLKEQLEDIIATTDGFSEMTLEGKQLQDLIEMRRKNGEADDPRLLNTNSLSYILFAFGKGAIGISNFGVLNKNQKTILSRFRKVFTFAYQRYAGLAQAEAQAAALLAEKQRLEKTLSDLQLTQTQLIQSEKMASLGELTAGIAHEIQNPLNFVNNFSEVSKELLDEIKEELENGNLEEVKEIMKDVIQNLEKINHHGKRADGIVKGMLQHSRTSSGTKEPTNINVLADEYLRLAYHGLRAKDKSFNATLVTDFDNSIGNISIIPQDIGRVVLNLLTNAFYAVSERKTTVAKDLLGFKNVTGLDDYEPTITLTTKKHGNLVSISIKDNGNGIPKHALEKIFQPFFTTKPTGQGTGLGLSMSYDIVTKGHGGELKVETKEGEGTTFMIILPKDMINN